MCDGALLGAELSALGHEVRLMPAQYVKATIPGIGPIIATAVAAMVAEPSGFRSGREFAAWLGLVPPPCGFGRLHADDSSGNA
jgi:transposase